MAPSGVLAGISASLRLRLRYAPIPAIFVHHLPHEFNHRFDLAGMLERLATTAVQTPPMPYRLVKLAEAHW